jgi:DNA repair exonuclease SbcCD nuclease subunit
MKILHVSDTHIGYSAFRKATSDGINQREFDTYNAFQQFVDYTLKIKPDIILHAGDLFDSVRPNNRAITFAIQQLYRISKAKIPFVVIAGNHEHPKLKETGHIFNVFEYIDNVYPIYKGKYESLFFNIDNKRLAIHALPQCELKKKFDIELVKLKPDVNSNYNIFISHGAVKGIKEFSMNEFNELIIPAKFLSKDFDYIALGHYHKFTSLGKNAFYSGSTERFSFTDAPDKKGFIDLELKKGMLETKFVELKTRSMIDYQPIKCSHLRLEEVMKKIRNTINELQPKEKTYRITLDKIPQHIYRGLDFNEIRKLSSEAVHYEIKAHIVKEEGEQSSASKIDTLASEFKQYVENQNLNDKEILLELGMGYIEKNASIEEGK